MKINNGEIITNSGSKIIGNEHIVNDSESPIITRQKIITLDDMLNEVNYDFVGYIPTSHALIFVNFIKEVNAGQEENLTPIFHLKLMDAVFNEERRCAVLIFRGGAKSTLLAEYVYLFIASFGFFPGWAKVNLAIYVTDSIENGVKNLRRNVEFRYANSDFLQKLIPNRKITIGTEGIGYVDTDIYEEQYVGGRKFTDIRLEFKNRSGHQTVIKGFGISTGIRGPLALSELVYTDSGSKTIKDIKVNEKIFGSDGILTTVIGKSEIFNDPMYELIFADGRKLKVNHNHLNPLLKWTEKRCNGKRIRKYEKVNITTEELFESKLKNGTLNKFLTEIPEPLQFSEKNFKLDPYLLGLALGDGWIPYSKGLRITGMEDDIKYYAKIIEKKYDISIYESYSNIEKMLRISVHGITENLRQLKIAGVVGCDKFIPKEYFCGSVDQRRDLLSGLLDTDGCCCDGSISFTNISKHLAYGVAELARGLGYYVSHSTRKEFGNRKKLYRLNIRGFNNPFKLPRKANKWKKPERFKGRIPLIEVNKIEDEPSQCIRVNNDNHEFITTGMLVTHNTRELGQRPKLATLDDLISSDDVARSPTMLSSIKNTIYKDVSKALHPSQQKIIYVGTPFNEADPLVEAINSRTWNKTVFPVCEHFDSLTTKETFKGAWAERFPFEYVKAEYDEAMDLGNPSYFFQELMLQISSEDERLVLDSDIKWYEERSSVTDNKQNYNFFIYTDFATSERKTSDYSIITVFAYGDDKKFRWVDGVMAKQDMWENIKALFRLVKEYNPMAVGVEVSGQQGGFIPWIYREMNERNVYFNIASENNNGNAGIRPSTNKFARFNVVLPYFKQGKILFPKDYKYDPRLVHGVNEISRITKTGIKSRTDDFIDTISQIPLITVFEPQIKKTEIIQSDEDKFLKNKYFPKIEQSDDDVKTPLDSYIR